MTSFFNAVAKVLLSILFQKIYFLYMYVIVKYVIWALKKANRLSRLSVNWRR